MYAAIDAQFVETVCNINCCFKIVSLNEARGGIWRGRWPEPVLDTATFARGSDRATTAHRKTRLAQSHWCHLRNFLVFTGRDVGRTISHNSKSTVISSSSQCVQTVSFYTTTSLNVVTKWSKTLSLGYSGQMSWRSFLCLVVFLFWEWKMFWSSALLRSFCVTLQIWMWC